MHFDFSSELSSADGTREAEVQALLRRERNDRVCTGITFSDDDDDDDDDDGGCGGRGGDNQNSGDMGALVGGSAGGGGGGVDASQGGGQFSTSGRHVTSDSAAAGAVSARPRPNRTILIGTGVFVTDREEDEERCM